MNDLTRIVGGSEATPHSIPWQVSLVHVAPGNTDIFCGGTLITTHHVLTAAHCIENNDFDVIVGDHDYADRSEGTLHHVCRVTNHPQFNPETNEYDVSIVHLREAARIGPGVITACLPKQSFAGDILIGETLTVSGWGKLSANGNRSNVLQHASVPVISNEACKMAYKNYTEEDFKVNITSHMLCAGDVEKGDISPCVGDSGGRYMYRNYLYTSYNEIGIVHLRVN